MSGVFGVYSPTRSNLVSEVYYGIYALQHRGQESCGIAVNDGGVITSHKDVGLVDAVFDRESLARLGDGEIAIGHCHYSKRVTATRANAQPMTVNHMKGQMALAMNGALINAPALRHELELLGSIFHSLSDSELIATTIVHERLRAPSIEAAVSAAMCRLEGAYSLVLMSPRKLIGARDPLGFRPLVLGERDGVHVLASESCALDAVGATFVRDVEPGEIVVIDHDGLRSLREHVTAGRHALCAFEYIYFARPDSVVEGTQVHEARKRLGAALARSHPVAADVVLGVPDSGIDAALGYAEASGIPYGLGFIKNKYIGRTFIRNDQREREDRVRIKLNVIESQVRGRRVVMVDDSIVRGTTVARIVRLLRLAGAREIHVLSSAPPFLNPCYFGTDIDSREDLIAVRLEPDEIAQRIGADSVGFLRHEDVNQMVAGCPLDLCKGCFSGCYPLAIPPDLDARRIEDERRFGARLLQAR